MEGIVPFAFDHHAVDGGSGAIKDIDSMGDVSSGGIAKADIGVRRLQLVIELRRDGVIILLCWNGSVILEITFAYTNSSQRLAEGSVSSVLAIDVVA